MPAAADPLSRQPLEGIGGEVGRLYPPLRATHMLSDRLWPSCLGITVSGQPTRERTRSQSWCREAASQGVDDRDGATTGIKWHVARRR